MAQLTPEQAAELVGGTTSGFKSVNQASEKEITRQQKPQISEDFIQTIIFFGMVIIVLVILIKNFKKYSVKIKNIFLSQRFKNTLIFIIGFSIFIFLLIGLFNLFKKDEWIGYLYINNNTLNSTRTSPRLNSLEECRDWVVDEVQDLKLRPSEFDYECGLNCKNKNGMNVCKETLN